MAQEGLQLFGGDWTERKLDAVGQYLKAYGTALKNHPFKRIYIDAFAGTGYREQPSESALPDINDIFADDAVGTESQKFLDGSARIALQVVPKFDKYIFVENDSKRADELEKLKTDFPSLAGRIEVKRNDANLAIQELCTKWDQRHQRGVVFVDPFGLQVDWVTVEAIAKTSAIDTWILFPFAINRLLTKYPKDIPAAWRQRLTRIFGNDEWLKRFYYERAEPDMFAEEQEVVVEKRRITLQGLGAYYKERLEAVFSDVAPNPRILENSRGAPLFQLFFAAGNPKGGPIAIRIAQHILNNI